MGGGETAAEGGRIITMVRRFWGPAPPLKDLGASPLNSLNLAGNRTQGMFLKDLVQSAIHPIVRPAQ
jgi:hypothetical protein